jgi:hypothetical protein
MALTKNIALPFNPAWGLTYHRIEQLSYNRAERVLEIVIGSYVSEADATAGAPPVAVVPVIRVQGDDADIALAALHDAAGALAYDLLREICPALEDAANA